MSELDRYLDDLGRHLATARPRPRTRLFALVATGAVALVVALAVSLLGGGSATDHRAIPVGPVDAVAKARAALTVPPGQMLHMRIRTQPTELGETVDELWAAADPPRWRQTFTSSRAAQTSAFLDGAYSHYDHKTNGLRRVTGYADDSPQAKVRTLLGIGEGDPTEELRAALAKGKLVDTGEQRIDGRTVRRLATKDKDDPNALMVFFYDVDPQTFAPVGGERIYYLPARKPGGPRRAGPPPIRFTVEVYERIPVDEARFVVKTNAQTKVRELTKEQFARRIKAHQREETKCAKLRKQNKRAPCPDRIISP